jgi:5-methylcytosine-specific restriction enzyme subunit McrC
MDGIETAPVTRQLLRQQVVGRNDPDDRLILALCDLVRWLRLPTEATGHARLRDLDYETLTLHAIYELFVARFYQVHLRPAGWDVRRQSPLKWPVTNATPGALQHLPGMQVDVAVCDPLRQRRIIIDTKFTEILKDSATRRDVFSSGHLYQMYAYLRSQEGGEQGQSEGLLLYPAVSHQIDETLEIQGHLVRFATVDLNKPWAEVETSMIHIVTQAASGRGLVPIGGLNTGAM